MAMRAGRTPCCVRLPRLQSPSNHKHVQNAGSVTTCCVQCPVLCHRQTTVSSVTICCVQRPIFCHSQTTNTYRMPAQLQLAVFACSNIIIKPKTRIACPVITVKPQTRTDCLLFQFCVIAVKPQTRTARNASSDTNCYVRLLRPESPSNHKNVQTADSVTACYVHLHITIKHKHVQTARTVTTCCVQCHRQTRNMYRLPAYNLLCFNAASTVTVKPQTCTECQL